MSDQDYAKVNDADPCEYVIVFADGGRTFTGGFDTAASVLRSIHREWHSGVSGAIPSRLVAANPDLNYGIDVCDSVDGDGPWHRCLINPANVVCVTDRRPSA